MSDRVFASVCLGICGLIVYQMWHLNVPFSYEPLGPKAFPILLAVLMGICSGMMLISPDRDIQWPSTALLAKGGLLIATFLAYTTLFEQLGFPLVTTAMVIVVSRLFGGRWVTGVVTGLIIGVSGYFFFNGLLQVTLPLGRVWS